MVTGATPGNLSLSIIMTFGTVSPAIAAFPVSEVIAARGAPTIDSSLLGLGAATFCSSGAGAPTVASVVVEALCRFYLRITRCLLKSTVLPLISRRKRSLADSCMRSSYSRPFASHSFFMSAMHWRSKKKFYLISSKNLRWFSYFRPPPSCTRKCTHLHSKIRRSHKDRTPVDTSSPARCSCFFAPGWPAQLCTLKLGRRPQTSQTFWLDELLTWNCNALPPKLFYFIDNFGRAQQVFTSFEFRLFMFTAEMSCLMLCSSTLTILERDSDSSSCAKWIM